MAEANAATWRKARRCGGGACVEVALLPDGTVLIRDSKDRYGPALRFTFEEWEAFSAAVKAGEFDDEFIAVGELRAGKGIRFATGAEAVGWLRGDAGHSAAAAAFMPDPACVWPDGVCTCGEPDRV